MDAHINIHLVVRMLRTSEEGALRAVDVHLRHAASADRPRLKPSGKVSGGSRCDGVIPARGSSGLRRGVIGTGPETSPGGSPPARAAAHDSWDRKASPADCFVAT